MVFLSSTDIWLSAVSVMWGESQGTLYSNGIHQWRCVRYHTLPRRPYTALENLQCKLSCNIKLETHQLRTWVLLAHFC